jgi:hypothetical protein
MTPTPTEAPGLIFWSHHAREAARFFVVFVATWATSRILEDMGYHHGAPVQACVVYVVSAFAVTRSWKTGLVALGISVGLVLAVVGFVILVVRTA